MVATYPDKKKTFEKNTLSLSEKKLQALDQAYQDGLKDAKQKNLIDPTRGFPLLDADWIKPGGHFGVHLMASLLLHDCVNY